MHRHLFAVGALHLGVHRVGIFGAEIEDLPHFDAAGAALAFFRYLGKYLRIMGLIRAGVAGGELLQHRAAGVVIIGVDLAVAEGQIGDLAVIENLRLARFGQHEELMRVVAADGARVGAHRDRLQAHPLIGAQIADQMAVIGVQRVFFGEVEVVAVLHQELTPPHHAETRADLVTEFPLDVVERQRQVLVRADMAAEDVGDHLLVGGAIEHVAVLPVADAQHLGAIGVIAARFLPQVRRLQRRHQHRDMAHALLLLVHDLFDLAQHLVAQRQPRIDPRAGLLDHPRPQHQPVADDLRLGRVFLQHG